MPLHTEYNAVQAVLGSKSGGIGLSSCSLSLSLIFGPGALTFLLAATVPICFNEFEPLLSQR
jgi:hypothetical protein